MSISTPVVLIFFRRAAETARVFEEIRRARPRRLFLVADGARPDAPGEAEAVAAARAVVERVDWDCEVERDYAKENLGCGVRPASGLDAVFRRVERAIVLEDDTVPHPTFFRFCDELLERYADDERVVQIAGHAFGFDTDRFDASYAFSRYNVCSGAWATWGRAWRHMDFDLASWPERRETSWLDDLHGHRRAAEYWRRVFDMAHAHGRDAHYWDYQWTFACWLQGGLTVIPDRPLASNVGFGPGATHTTWPGDPRAGIEARAMDFPLRHPSRVAADAEADRNFFERVVAPQREAQPADGGPSLGERIGRRLKSYLGSTLRRAFRM